MKELFEGEKSSKGVTQAAIEFADGLDFDDPTTGEAGDKEGPKPDPGSTNEEPDAAVERTIKEEKLIPIREEPDREDAAGDDAGDGGDEPQFDEGVLAMAGLSAAEAASHFRTQEELENALRWQDSQALRTGRAVLDQQAAWQMQQQQGWQPQGWQPPPQQPQRPTATYGGQQQTPPQEPDLNFEGEGWDEETVKLLRNMHGFYTNKIGEAHARAARLEALMAQQQAMNAQRESERILDEFDNRLNSLGEDYLPVFGKGTRSTINPMSPQFQNRRRLNEAMQAIQYGRSAQGYAPLPADQLFDRALRAEFADLHDKTVRKETAQRMTRRSSQMTNRPTRRQGTPLRPETAAAKRVSKFFQKVGIPLMPEANDGLDGEI